MIPALSMLIAIVYDSRTTSVQRLQWLFCLPLFADATEIALAMVVAGTFLKLYGA